MKKVLSLTLALMMLFSMCIVPVVVAEPDGSAANPYYVANPMATPGFITIPANSTVYYQYNAMVFNGWEVGGYGLSAITVDGVVYDTPNMWGELYAPLNFNMMSPGVVGYVNNTADEIQVMLTHNEPAGTLENPAEMDDGDNFFSIPVNMMEYVSVYLPEVSGDYTFSTEQVEDFQIIVFADASPAEGGTPNFVENGSLTLTLESWIPVYVIVSPIGMTGDAVVTVTPPKAGTVANPIWLGADEMYQTYSFEAGQDLHFNVDGSFAGNTLTIESVAGAEFTALMNGAEYASEGGVLSIVLESANWYIELILSSSVDNEVAFSMAYAEGTMENPIELVLGDNAISIPAGVAEGYYYSYIVEKDGLLVATPSDRSVLGLLSMGDETYKHYAFMMADSNNSYTMIPVTAGEVITFSVSGLDDEETWEKLPVDIALNLEWKDLVLLNTFEEGDLGGWSSRSGLTADDMEYYAGWYSAKFEATADWANMFHDISVEKNTDYIITFTAKAANNGPAWVKFHKADWSGDVAQGDVNLTTEWADYEITLNSGDNTSLVFMFQHAGYAADGQIIWLDDIVVTKVPSEEPAVVYGDVNGDGKINNRDLGVLQQFVNGFEVAIDEAAADVNGDGKINNRDLGLLQQFVNGFDVELG